MRKIIAYSRLWETLKNKGISTYTLRERYNIESRTIRRLKANQNLTTDTLSKLCAIIGCGLDDIAEYLPDKVDNEKDVRKLP